jgi:hypothetical protein
MNEKAPGAPSPADGKKAASKIITNLLIVTLVTVVTFVLLAMAHLTYVAILLMIGLMPSIVARILDRRPGKVASRTILAFNLAGIFKHILYVFTSGDPNSAAQTLISDPFTWLWVYIFATFGWVIVRILPQIAILILSLRAEYTIKRMRGIQEKLIKEWGDNVKK